eukprot:jgi/Mesvir1/20349/Mv19936-RA.1
MAGPFRYIGLWRTASFRTSHVVRDMSKTFPLTRFFSSTPSPAPSLATVVNYCRDQVRTCDYEGYLCSLLLPPHVQPPAFILRAFNVEMAQVVDSTRAPMCFTRAMRTVTRNAVPVVIIPSPPNVSQVVDRAHKEQKIALMRFQWWRETLDACLKGKPVEHPIAQGVAAVAARHRITRQWLLRILDERAKDAEDPSQPRTVADLERYAEHTASSLLYLLLQVAGASDANTDHAASHVGKAVGLTTLLRGTAAHASQRRTYIPRDVAAKHGVVTEEIYRRIPSDALSSAVFEVASKANAHLDKARKMQGTLSKEARAVLLPAVPCGLYLAALERHNFDVFYGSLMMGKLDISPLSLQLRLKWHAWRSSF